MKKLNHQEKLNASLEFEENKLKIVTECKDCIINGEDNKQKKSFLLKKRRKLMNKINKKIKKLQKELDRLL